MKGLLEAGGSSLDQMIRIDQFSPTRDFMEPYLEVRNSVLARARPASTALQVERLMLDEALVQVDGIAIASDGQLQKTALNTDKVSRPPAGYSLAISAGDLIFASGATPTDYRSAGPWPAGEGTGVAEEARVDANFWFGSEIKKQTAYVLQKLDKYLVAADSGLRNAVKAQAYLADMADHFAFLEAWRAVMGDSKVALSVVPVKGMSTRGGRVEINMVATRPAAKRTGLCAPGIAQALCGGAHAVRAGDLLFISGQMACNDAGPLERSNDPFSLYRSSARVQMDAILRTTSEICAAAGGSLKDIVRAQLFYTDLKEVAESIERWKDAFPDHPPAATFVEVPSPLAVPGCTILADFVAWLPD